MNRIVGLLSVAALVLVTIYAYNHFSDKDVSQLGKKLAA